MATNLTNATPANPHPDCNTAPLPIVDPNCATCTSTTPVDPIPIPISLSPVAPSILTTLTLINPIPSDATVDPVHVVFTNLVLTYVTYAETFAVNAYLFRYFKYAKE
jgi:hypothetical protein